MVVCEYLPYLDMALSEAASLTVPFNNKEVVAVAATAASDRSVEKFPLSIAKVKSFCTSLKIAEALNKSSTNKK